MMGEQQAARRSDTRNRSSHELLQFVCPAAARLVASHPCHLCVSRASTQVQEPAPHERQCLEPLQPFPVLPRTRSWVRNKGPAHNASTPWNSGSRATCGVCTILVWSLLHCTGGDLLLASRWCRRRAWVGRGLCGVGTATLGLLSRDDNDQFSAARKTRSSRLKMDSESMSMLR